MDSSVASASDKRQYFNGLAAFLGVDTDYAGVKAYAHRLFNIDLTDFEPRDFPITDFLAEQKRCSMPVTHAWWDECLENACLVSTSYDTNKTAIPSDKSTEVDCNDLYDQFRAWAEHNRQRHGPRTKNLFFKDLNSVLPLIVRRTHNQRMYTIPPLGECRRRLTMKYPGCGYEKAETLDDSIQNAQLLLQQAQQRLDVLNRQKADRAANVQAYRDAPIVPLLNLPTVSVHKAPQI
ncbi:hypothetical protein KJ807_05580 [Patescibacteria group bacterium]|nr:hypothetical protein [Patescibacteria group bacterium]